MKSTETFEQPMAFVLLMPILIYSKCHKLKHDRAVFMSSIYLFTCVNRTWGRYWSLFRIFFSKNFDYFVEKQNRKQKKMC